MVCARCGTRADAALGRRRSHCAFCGARLGTRDHETGEMKRALLRARRPLLVLMVLDCVLFISLLCLSVADPIITMGGGLGPSGLFAAVTVALWLLSRRRPVVANVIA